MTREEERRIASNLDPERFRRTRSPRDPGAQPDDWAKHAKRLRDRLPNGTRAYIRSGDEPDGMRVIVDDASLRRLTGDNAQAVEALIAKFGADLTALVGAVAAPIAKATTHRACAKCGVAMPEADNDTSCWSCNAPLPELR